MKELLKGHKFSLNIPCLTPLPFKFEDKLLKNQTKVVTTYPYRQILGKIMHLRHTRPDILYAIHILSKLSSKVTEMAIYGLEHCLQYLQHTLKHVRTFYGKGTRKNLSLIAFCDATWATYKLTRKSVGGNCIFLGGSLIHAVSRQQKIIATSSGAAELTELFYTAKNMEHLSGFIEELGVHIKSKAILTDSITTVNTLEKPTQKEQKHLSVYIAYLKDLVLRLPLKLLFIKRDFNLADIMAKQGSTQDFVRFVKMLQEPFEWRHICLGSSNSSTSE